MSNVAFVYAEFCVIATVAIVYMVGNWKIEREVRNANSRSSHRDGEQA